MIDIPASALKVQMAALRAGLPIEVVLHAQSARTAEEAALACGCQLGQIVKSLVFRGAVSGTPMLFLVSGPNRVNERAIARYVGEKLERPDGAFVREATGFAIGGIPPFGHATPLPTYMDTDLLRFDVVWAAAGTPTAVFSAEPGRLREAANATVIAVG
jgi:prolyl-tRNA editing enzyme YbaK/EbsC (Cys-tRNA(Pro) deacylase)